MSDRRLVAVVAMAVALCGGCSGDDYGGVGTLPGPVPTDVAFVSPPAGAPPAPDFTLPLVDGNRTSGSALWRDRPVVVLFTASWCEACAELHREIVDVVTAFGGAVGLLAVVGEDDEEAARQYARDLRLQHPVVIDDGRVWHDFSVREPPLVAVVAAGGGLLRGWPGGVDHEVLTAELNGLIRAAAPPAGS